MLRGASAVFAHEADRVRIVDHDERVVLLREIADALEVCDVAVHGEDAVGRDQLDAAVLRLLELRLEVFHVVVVIAQALCLAQTHTVDDRRVVQLVGDDRVLRSEQGLKETAVRIEAGRIEDRVLHARELRDARFELLVDALRAADEADGGKTEAPLVVARLCGGDQLGVVGKSEVVVRAHIDDRLRLGRVDAASLRRRDDALLLVRARLADRVKLFLIDRICFLHWFFSSVISLSSQR